MSAPKYTSLLKLGKQFAGKKEKDIRSAWYLKPADTTRQLHAPQSSPRHTGGQKATTAEPTSKSRLYLLCSLPLGVDMFTGRTVIKVFLYHSFNENKKIPHQSEDPLGEYLSREFGKPNPELCFWTPSILFFLNPVIYLANRKHLGQCSQHHYL